MLKTTPLQNETPEQRANKIMLVPLLVIDGLVQYLSSKPYSEVAEFLNILQRFPIIDSEQVKKTTEAPKDDTPGALAAVPATPPA